MKLKFAVVLAGTVLAGAALGTAGSAMADGYYGGTKDRVRIPAPIPEDGAFAVPVGRPIPEGFTYYLRADLGWSFAGNRSYGNNDVYGDSGAPFQATTPFGFGGAGFSSSNFTQDGVFVGTIGTGMYFSPHFRGDLTLDFRSQEKLSASGDYSYANTSDPSETVEGSVRDALRVNSVVAMANIYVDLLPRGRFTPYVGAGIGFVYNDASRSYSNVETEILDPPPGASQTLTGSSKSTGVTLAAALMAGASIAIDQHWMIDISYRALYLGGFDLNTTLMSGDTPVGASRVEIGDSWEHQARIGLRYNIW